MTKKLFLIAFIFIGLSAFSLEGHNSLFAKDSFLSTTINEANNIEPKVFTLNALMAAADKPVLSNFRIEIGEEDKVYFDSNIAISASTTNGFIISGKTITSITVVPGQTTGHYFTVSTPFNFWDNNTIRYSGSGSDFASEAGFALAEMTLEYIDNNISEPEALDHTYYVATDGSDSNNGTTIDAPFRTIQQAIKIAKAGSTVWIKAGTYTNSANHTTFSHSGTIDKPIKVIGYKTTPGDINGMYYNFQRKVALPELDPSEMPIMNGGNTRKYGLFANGKNYLIVKNMQFTGYSVGLNSWSGIGYWVDNCVFKDNYGIASGSVTGAGITLFQKHENGADYLAPSYYRLTNLITLNSGITNVAVFGSHDLIENVTSYCDTENARLRGYGTDYYISFNGSNNIVRNSYADRSDNAIPHDGHGIGVRGVGTHVAPNPIYKSHYNLIEKNYSFGSKESYYVRNTNVRFNVFKDNVAEGFGGKTSANSVVWGIVFMSDTKDNIFERMEINNMGAGIAYYQGTESGPVNTHIENNIVRNSTFNNVYYGMWFINYQEGRGVAAHFNNNKILNCTFNNAENLARTNKSLDYYKYSNNQIINSVFNNVKKLEWSSRHYKFSNAFSIDHSNFSNNGFAFPTYATNSSEHDPLFVNAAAGDFHLQDSSKIKDSGIDLLNDVIYDKGGIERSSGMYSMGAYDDEAALIGSVMPDPTICIGESVTLLASGGTEYLWNTGETTESIEVSPDTTTTYTVTITDGSDSDEHEITVTVNDAPTVDLGPDVSICFGEEITLTANGTGDFLWSTGETTPTITITPTDTTTYTVTASNSCSTDATDEVVVTVNPDIALTVTPDLSLCSAVGGPLDLVATGNGDFLWSTGETTPTISVNPTVTTTYSVTSTLGSCSDTKEVTVTVSDSPSVDVGPDVSMCYGEAITLTATGVGDFLWNTGETTASITVSPLDTTTYSVTASNSCSTVANDEIVVTVNPEIGLTVAPSTDVSICNGESIELIASGNGTFLWSTGETTPNITVNPSATTTYSVTVTSGDCSESEDVIVTVFEAPTVDAGADVAICSGDLVVLTATGVGDFLWSNGETTESITVLPTVTTTYTVTASNSCSASATDEVIVTVTPEIGLSLDTGPTASICSGETIDITATGNGSFLWSTGETTPTISVSPTSTTTYSVTATSGTCTEESEVVVTVSDPPSVNAGPDVSICEGDGILLSASGDGDFLWSTGETTASITVFPDVTTTYSVTVSNSCSTATDEVIVTVTPEIGLEITPNQDVSICAAGESIELTASGTGDFLWSTGETTSTITVSPNVDTIYSVTVTSGTCSESEEVLVVVYESPFVNAGADTTVCAGESVTLTAEGNGEFLWSTGETTPTITVSPTTNTTYSVSTTTFCGATVSDDVNVTVLPGVNLELVSNVTICQGENITLSATSDGDFLWNTGEATASITVSPISTTTYTLTSVLGECSTTKEVTVTVNELPLVNAGNDVSICIGEDVMLTATGNGTYLWNTGETTPSITVAPSDTTIYTVTTTNSCGTHSDEIIVNVTPEISLEVTPDATICSNESITLSASSNGSVLWDTGETTSSITVNPATSTTYSVTSTLNGCSSTEEIIVTVNEALVVDAGLDVTICEGEEVTLTATGTGNFLWNTGETETSISVSPSETTTYTITTSSAGNCGNEVTDTVTVNVNRKPVATANDDLVILSGTSIDLTVSGVGSFEWSTGEVGSRISVSPTETTVYTVTASTGEGCFVEDDIVVTVVDELEPTEITITAGQDATICPGDTVIIEAPSGTSYLWSTGETERSIRVTPTEKTIYSVKVYNGDESETSHSTITVNERCLEGDTEVEISSFDLDQEMTVYPNPTKGMLNVKLKGYNNNSTISIYNLNGAMLYTNYIENKLRASVVKEQIDLSKFPKGIYFVKLSNNGKHETKKVILM